MKITLFYTLIFITFLMLAYVPTISAQDTSLDYVVRVVYFVPKDREPNPDMNTNLDSMIKDIQIFYANEMDRHGFSGKTFEYETDGNGNVKVHQLIGKYNDVDYISNNKSGSDEIDEHFNLVYGQFKNIYLNVFDYSNERVVGDSSAAACGSASSFSIGGEASIPASGSCFTFEVAAHELGHTFGLPHDFRNNSYMMSYGNNRNQLSQCAAEWLDVNRYFNATQEDRDTSRASSIQMLSSTFVSAPDIVRLRFEVSDPDGLHQAQLRALTGSSFSLIACDKLNGQSDIAEFVTGELFGINVIDIHILDTHGNDSIRRFNIDITDLLPSPGAISIPDTNLAAGIRDELDLASDSPITTVNILGLEKLIVERTQLQNLTGLEHATNLRRLFLSNNQIEDITTLAELTQLRILILRENKIKNVTPLAGLTKLTWLNLGDNQISDVTPLAGLTELTHLLLWNNQINEVSSLTGLTNLVELNLRENPMRNRESLLTIQSKNPNANIYIDPVVENRAPVFTESPNATRLVMENAAVGTNIGGPISATDADNDTLTYTLGGTDKDAFDIDSTNGQLKPKQALNLILIRNPPIPLR